MSGVRSLGLLLAGTLLIQSGGAQAVSKAANGAGQVLIYPYYTVRNAPWTNSPYNTLFSVVNASGQGKAVKIRFREALAGATVFEANVFLSVRDVWTAAVVPIGQGAGIMSVDKSCTLPSVAPGTSGVPSSTGLFRSSAYASDPLGPDASRVTEGFVEVLELGTIRNGSDLERKVTHIAGVAPCNLGSEAAVVADLEPPSGRLYGSVTLISVLEGTAYSFDAVALADWSRVQLYSSPGSNLPTLADANPSTSSLVVGDELVISTWETGVDAVNAALSAGNAEAEFMADPAVAGGTDIVYTAPTKPLLVSADAARPPFTRRLTAGGACEPTGGMIFSREEQLYLPPSADFGLPGSSALCWATTVQSLNAPPAGVVSVSETVVGSHAPFRYFVGGIETSPAPTIYREGVAIQNLALGVPGRDVAAPGNTLFVDIRSGSQTSSPAVVYPGLPIVGVSFVRYANGQLVTNGEPLQSNYGAGAAVKIFPVVKRH